MYNEFDHSKDFSKGFKILHKQDIGNWSNLGSFDESDFFDFLFRRPVVTETPTPEEPDGSTLICGNSYFNNNRVVSIYYNGVDLCATPPDEIATPETPTPRPNVIGRLVLRIDTRLNSPIGSNTPFSSGASRRAFDLQFSGVATYDVDFGSESVIGGKQNSKASFTNVNKFNSGQVSYLKPGIYTVTVSARSAFDLEYPDIGGFGNCLLSINYPDNRGVASNLDNNYFGCINLVTVDFPSRDESNRPFGKNKIRSLRNTFEGCTSLTNVGFLTTNVVSQWGNTFAGCTSLQTIPNFDYSSVRSFNNTFQNSGLVKFDSAVPFGAGAENFRDCWNGCSNLRDFAPGQFDNILQSTVGKSSLVFAFGRTFQGCALTAASIENILVSLAKTKTPGIFLNIDGGTNAGKSTWTANAIAAYNTLISRSWIITFNP